MCAEVETANIWQRSRDAIREQLQNKDQYGEKIWFIAAALLMIPVFWENRVPGLPGIVKIGCIGGAYLLLLYKIFFLDNTGARELPAAFAGVVVIGAGVYFSGTHTFMDMFMLVLGVRNVSFQKICRFFAWAIVLFFLITVVSCWTGLIEDYTEKRAKSVRFRHGMGFGHPNEFGQWGLLVVIALLLARRGKLKLPDYLGMLLLMVGIYWLSDSRAALMGGILCILGVYLVSYLEEPLNNVELAPRWSAMLVVLAAVLFMAVAWRYDKKIDWMLKLNKLFSDRLRLSHKGFLQYGLPMLGQRFELKYPLDALYVYVPIRMGVIPTAMYVAFAALAVSRGAKQGRWDLVAICLTLALYSAMEFGMVRFLNVTLFAAMAKLDE